VRFSPVLCSAVLTQSLSRQKWRFTAPRAEANKRLKPVAPLISIYRAGERFRLGGQLRAHRHNELLEIRASFARAKKARQAFSSKTIHGKIVTKGDAKAGSVLLIVGTVCLDCSQRCHSGLPSAIRELRNCRTLALPSIVARVLMPNPSWGKGGGLIAHRYLHPRTLR